MKARGEGNLGFVERVPRATIIEDVLNNVAYRIFLTSSEGSAEGDWFEAQRRLLRFGAKGGKWNCGMNFPLDLIDYVSRRAYEFKTGNLEEDWIRSLNAVADEIMSPVYV